MAIHPCEGYMCQNGGTRVISGNSFICNCEDGFTGDRCEDVDECFENPCQNNGTCQDGINTFSCDCADGFNGNTCDTNIDDCHGVVCQNNGHLPGWNY